MKRYLSEIPKVVEAGVSSFKVYLAYGFRLTDREIYDAIEAIKPTELLLEHTVKMVILLMRS